MRETILQRLGQLEAEEGLAILYACESGSRAWGFASKDSDWDVRFIYARRPEWYLSVRPGRDVIELPLVDDMDYGGWDIRKALWLLRRSNPALLEWLVSPIVYRQRPDTLEPLKALIPVSYNRRASAMHYLSMAAHNNTQLVAADGRVRRKKYLYILRSLLAGVWSATRDGQPPMNFEALLASFDLPEEVLAETALLLAQKRSGSERDSGERSAVLDNFADELRAKIESADLLAVDLPELGPYDTAFRETLGIVWGPAPL
jgi:predicted nucleotidyltransferase